MKNVIFVLPFILLLGCAEKQTKNAKCDLTAITVTSKVSLPFELSDISQDVFYVKLATEDSCLVGNINKLCYVNDHIVIGSDNNTLLFFNKDGTFDHKICRKGNGPGEYRSISDFDIDGGNNTISILDMSKKQILHYDWDGNFIGKDELNHLAIGFQSLNDSVSILYSGNQISADNEYKLALHNSYSHTVFNRFHPISRKKSNYLHVHSANNFSRCQDEVLFCELYNDTIYSISTSGCTPRYYIDFGDEKVPSSFYEKDYDNIMEFQSEFSKHGFSYGINALANLPTGFIASCFIQKKKHFIYYDKAAQTGTIFNELTDKMDLGDMIIDIVEHNVAFYSDGGYLLMLADNELYMQGKDSTLKKRWGDMKIDDNPIVRICKL